MIEKNPNPNSNEPVAFQKTLERKPCTNCGVKVHFSWRYCPACGTPTGYKYKGRKTTIEELATETATKLLEIIKEEDEITIERAAERLIEELQYQLHHRSHIPIEIAKLV